MRKIYLIRHAMPCLPYGVRVCVGRTNLPLGTLGRLQAALLGVAFKDTPLTAVYCSNLLRSRQTATPIGGPVTEILGLEEMDAGEWDGLTFDEIGVRWPTIYEQRGKDPSVSPPGAETRESGQKRFMAAVRRVLSESIGDIVIVAHASVMQTLFCNVLGLPLDNARGIKLPYGSVSLLSYEDSRFFVHSIGVSPHPSPNVFFCEQLLVAAVPPNIAAHCKAVAKEALRIAENLIRAGALLNVELILAASMLHDIARMEEDHAAVGAAQMHALGYPEIAEIIRQHHSLDDVSRIDEAAVVFIADKCIQGTKKVTLLERFENSLGKCSGAEARMAHGKRFQAAQLTAARINQLCRRDVTI